jgi:hypothetical protein
MKSNVVGVVTIFLASVTGVAQANCVGSAGLYTCTDSRTGNSYTTQQLGNQTYTTGNNSRTGSTWNQQSQQLGDTTYLQGKAANGNHWQGTVQNFGGTQFFNGTDSNGNQYSKTCNQFGCYLFP